jgi:hypothetical protein
LGAVLEITATDTIARFLDENLAKLPPTEEDNERKLNSN